MPIVMTAQPNIRGALCETSVIPFLVPRRCGGVNNTGSSLVNKVEDTEDSMAAAEVHK